MRRFILIATTLLLVMASATNAGASLQDVIEAFCNSCHACCSGGVYDIFH